MCLFYSSQVTLIILIISVHEVGFQTVLKAEELETGKYRSVRIWTTMATGNVMALLDQRVFQNDESGGVFHVHACDYLPK